MHTAVYAESFADLKSLLFDLDIDWYFISSDGKSGKATRDIVCAAIDEELWGDRASHVIVDGDPGETCFDEVYFGRTELTAFRKYEDDEYVFLMNFDEIDISALRTRGAEWYFSEMY